MNAIQDYQARMKAREDYMVKSVEPATSDAKVPEVITIGVNRADFETIKSALRMAIVEVQRQSRAVHNLSNKQVFAPRLAELKAKFDAFSEVLMDLSDEPELPTPEGVDVSVVHEDTMAPRPADVEAEIRASEWDTTADDLKDPMHVEYDDEPPSDGSPEA